MLLTALMAFDEFFNHRSKSVRNHLLRLAMCKIVLLFSLLHDRTLSVGLTGGGYDDVRPQLVVDYDFEFEHCNSLKRNVFVGNRSSSLRIWFVTFSLWNVVVVRSRYIHRVGDSTILVFFELEDISFFTQPDDGEVVTF